MNGKRLRQEPAAGRQVVGGPELPRLMREGISEIGGRSISQWLIHLDNEFSDVKPLDAGVIKALEYIQPTYDYRRKQVLISLGLMEDDETRRFADIAFFEFIKRKDPEKFNSLLSSSPELMGKLKVLYNSAGFRIEDVTLVSGYMEEASPDWQRLEKGKSRRWRGIKGFVQKVRMRHEEVGSLDAENNHSHSVYRALLNVHSTDAAVIDRLEEMMRNFSFVRGMGADRGFDYAQLFSGQEKNELINVGFISGEIPERLNAFFQSLIGNLEEHSTR